MVQSRRGVVHFLNETFMPATSPQPLPLHLPKGVHERIEYIECEATDVDFGAFGVIARMNTNFHLLKLEFNKKRRRTANRKVKEALQQIATDAIIAQTLL